MNPLLTFFCAGVILPVAAWAATTDSTMGVDRAEAVRSNSAFAIDLYAQLRNQPGNLFFSPESISMALAMTYAGARGETAAEMARTLHFMLSAGRLHPAMAALLRDRNAAHDGYMLEEADALWGQRGYSFLPDFVNLTKENYSAGFNTVDFKGNSEVARRTINEWVEHRTKNKIKDLIAVGVLRTETRLVLTNAIYFKGYWQTQFKKEDTREEDFHLSLAQTIKAPMMHRAGGFNYFDGGTFESLEIPYKNKELSMIVCLPKFVDGLTAFEQSLTPATMQQWLSRLHPEPNVIVSMPKFKTEAQFALNEALQSMGTHLAFSRGADFSGMVSKETILHDGSPYISAVIHKAYVDVNEEGTEAAAATAVVMSAMKIAHAILPRPIIFRADHPFLFVIRDNKSGAIRFMGRVADPSR